MDLATALSAALMAGKGMTDCLHGFLEAIGSALVVPRLALYDYDEHADAFDLLYFLGHPDESRTALHRRVFAPPLRRATVVRDAFLLDGEDGRALAIPLHFQDTLEAVLVLERPAPWDSIDAHRPAARLISKFLGLFMSSRRLPMNVRQDAAAADDLARAREVQLSYLPNPSHESEHVELFGHNRSSAQVGGDYFDYFQTREHCVQGIVADACGHGMGAALIMSTFRGLLHADVPCGDAIAPAFSRVNRRLYRDTERLQYLTGVYFDINEQTGQLHYVNAGHFEPMLMHQDGTVSRLQGGGPPLGMLPEVRYPAQTARTQPGDILILFTDGLVELADPAGEFFEVERILAAIQPIRHAPLRDISGHVIAEATRFRDRDDLADDLTLFMMRLR
jgi:sigma-B regulation protein RsbU (phosphoserine phosphatase)